MFHNPFFVTQDNELSSPSGVERSEPPERAIPWAIALLTSSIVLLGQHGLRGDDRDLEPPNQLDHGRDQVICGLMRKVAVAQFDMACPHLSVADGIHGKAKPLKR